MSELKLIIDYIDDVGTKIDSLSFNKLSNNISDYKVTNVNTNLSYDKKIFGEIKNGSSPFILGSSKLNENHTLANSYKGYISNYLTNEDGSSNFSVTINGTNIKSITISFNSTTNEYATEINVYAQNNFSSKNFQNSNNDFILTLDNPSTKIIINITKWSKGNVPIKITSISPKLSLSYKSNGNLLNLIRGSQIIDDNEMPAYGIIGNYGSATVYDKNKLIENLANNDLLYNTKNVKIYLDNNIIGSYITSSFEKQTSKNTVAIEFSSKILEMKNYSFPEKHYLNRVSALDIYFLLKNFATDLGFNFAPLNIYSKVYTRLNTTNIPNPTLNKDNLYNQFIKLCEITQTRIYENERGNIVIDIYD